MAKSAGYKLATYQASDGPRAGLVIEDKVFDAAALTRKPAYATVLGILAVALPIGLLQGVAKADDGGGSPNQVTIQEQASYILAGSVIDVGLNVKCPAGSGSGEVVVNVTQSPPETPVPVGAGSGPSPVVCDGQTHPVAVTITGFGFGAGDAFATADLSIGTQMNVAHAQRTIDIVVVGNGS